jgi:hypothetical protein
MVDLNEFKKGWKYAEQLQGVQAANVMGKTYIDTVVNEINKLEESINVYSDSQQNNAVLGGFIAEEYHAGTFNINAVAAGSKSRAFVGGSNAHASVDISTNFEKEYSLKYIKSAEKSVDSQLQNVLQDYHKYLSKAKSRGTQKPMSLDEYLNKYGYTNDMETLLTSVYNGQGRIIPSDQLEEAIKILKRKIATESARDGENRIYNLKNCLETLENLCDRIKSSDGIESIPLSKMDAEAIAKLCKTEGFKPEDFGITLDKTIKTQYILNQALKGGITGATLTLAIQIIPDIISIIYNFANDKKLDIDSIAKNGIECIAQGVKSFILGFTSCSVYISCKAGKFGSKLMSVNAPVIGSITALLFQVVQECYNASLGKSSAEQLRYILTKDLLVTCSSLLFGGIAVSILPIISGIAFMVGSVIGSVTASVFISVSDKIIVSLCVNSGYTLFGLVDQDYTLPIDILKDMGITINEVDRLRVKYNTVSRNTVTRRNVSFNYVNRIEIKMIKRGVIAFHKIGYIR